MNAPEARHQLEHARYALASSLKALERASVAMRSDEHLVAAATLVRADVDAALGRLRPDPQACAGRAMNDIERKLHERAAERALSEGPVEPEPEGSDLEEWLRWAVRGRDGVPLNMVFSPPPDDITAALCRQYGVNIVCRLRPQG